MPYQTGTASSPADLLDKLRIFCEGRGWTTHRNNIATTGDLSISKGSVYVNLDSDASTLYARGATGYDAALAWNAQPGHSGITASLNNCAGPYAAYHFFANTAPDYVYAVIETVAGIYRHLVFGSLIKTGTYTGGAFVDAVYWNYDSWVVNNSTDAQHKVLFDNVNVSAYGKNGQVRADVDGLTNKWFFFYANSSQAADHARGDGRGGFTYRLFDRTPNVYNELAVLLPITVMVYRTGARYSIIGQVPDVRLINITNLTPGATLTIGGETWRVFPIIQKNGPAGTPNSGNYGYAYRQVA